MMIVDDIRKYSVPQMESSGCGMTAIANSLLLFQYIDQAEIKNTDWSGCVLRKRDQSAPLPQYLASRSVAGCAGDELVVSMRNTLDSNDFPRNIIGNFIPFREVFSSLHDNLQLVEYLKERLNQNCVIIATLNLQVIGNDAWHHQLIYGLDTTARTIHCMNPIGMYTESQLIQYMSTPSILLVHREDIISRYNILSENDDIYSSSDWKKFHVKEQIDSIIQKSPLSSAALKNLLYIMQSSSTKFHIEVLNTHMIIPAIYEGGLTIFQKWNKAASS